MSIRYWTNVRLTRIFNYEYWPYSVFYFPMYIYGIYLAIRARSFTYFSTTNLNMKYGGIVGESKYKILQMIPSVYLPSTTYIQRNESKGSIEKKMIESGITFPIIAKPDVGERGKMVEKINDMTSLIKYQNEVNKDFLIQEFITLPMEAGVLYYRIPGSKIGNISSIVIKDFLKLRGDGKRTFEELLNSEIRAFSRRNYLKNKYEKRLKKIVEKDEEILLEPIGNHNRGTTFLNGNHLIDDCCEKLFTEISSQIPGFNYGRFDIKIKNTNDLKTGENLKILELNGISSEPGHIYDPNYRLIRAYKDLAKHMRIICQISKINYQNGVKRANLKPLINDIYSHLRNN